MLLHAAAVAALLAVGPKDRPALPPVYRVRLIAAPPGDRAIGTVTPPARTPPATRPTPRRTPPPTTTQRAPAARRTTAATANPPTTKTPPSKTAQPQAGGGPVGGRGTDVTNVNLGGIEFPFQAYLDNIVNQIAMRFPREWSAALSAEVTFLIGRDGSVRGQPRLTKRSGSFEFDTEALGAIELVGRRRAFGPLPAGFADDVLPVTFSFDPKIFR